MKKLAKITDCEKILLRSWRGALGSFYKDLDIAFEVHVRKL